ncbi:conserved hypothetical protein [Aeropyrum pernix K1]|uniref:ABC transporter substrate-binding protein PnrA-like domain-containing protein n=2 Tax=Aeropyrum pernix TaxID=56636 RepID=Q9YG40_AERPE|nr:conserved hypothetical protein [Aeropyrum pernix K1]
MSMNRRDFLKLAGAAGAGLVVGGLGGYILSAPRKQQSQAPTGGGLSLKALWIYVGPVEDYGWTRAHHDGHMKARSKLGWLESSYIETVSEDKAYDVIKAQLDAEGYDAVFATSYGYMDALKRLATEYPDVKFYHCSGPWEEFRDLPNVSTYFAEFYQLYYLNGLAAAGATETCNLGYIPAFLIPEVVRHINAYVIGAVEGAKVLGKCGDGRNIRVLVTPPLNSWFAPDKARDAARLLVETYDVDVIAYTEDTTAVLETAESYWDQGVKVYSFSHYTDMYAYFKSQGKTLRSHLTGQISDWGPIYVDLLVRQAAGVYEKIDIWARLGDYTPIRWAKSPSESLAGSPEGAVYLAPLNTEAIPAKMLEHIKLRYEQMKELLFEPFTGPIRGYSIDAQGRPQEDPKLKVREGERLGRNPLWVMDWLHENAETL